MLIFLALFCLQAFGSQGQAHVFETKTGCRLEVLTGGKTQPDIRYSDAIPMANRLAILRQEIMAEIPGNERARRSQVTLIRRAAAFNNRFGDFLSRRELHFNSRVGHVSERFYKATFENQVQELDRLEADLADWREFGTAGLAELVEADRLDLIVPEVPYDLPKATHSGVTAINFSNEIVRKIFYRDGGLRKVGFAFAKEILAGRIENDCINVTHQTVEAAKKYSVCGTIENGVFTTNKITTQKVSRD